MAMLCAGAAAQSSCTNVINQTQALALPGACKVKTPPTSQCNTKNAASPADSPAGTGSKSTPSTGDGSSR
ncbi:Bifunctional inhibitor/lipid-transfer protein/seed storage 2S albumin superfamily protein [Trifolium repens]|nr:Bifunctional inhibitor/lipid-transfer protein/seed storage 2S albumin superfamily protein [Trifolium repens]